MADYRFERECRTPSSEAYEILEGEERLGKVDLHFTDTVVHATLVLERDFTEDKIQDLIEIIDQDLVETAGTPRNDFLVTVFRGHEVGVYSDEVFEGVEEEGNGNHH